ncbi:MAG: hypothetical protein ACT4QE_17235 [Anaerolineales bacterium]
MAKGTLDELEKSKSGSAKSRFLSREPDARLLRQSGSHEIWNVKGTLISNPVHGNRDHPTGLHRKLVKQIAAALGLTALAVLVVLPFILT